MRSRSTLHQLVLAIRKRNTFIHHHHMNIQAETFSIYVITQLVAGSRYKIAVMGKSQIKSQVQITNHLQK